MLFLNTTVGVLKIIFIEGNIVRSISLIEAPGDAEGELVGGLGRVFRNLILPEARSSFEEAVRRVVCGVSPGETITYGEVADLMGCPGASRAVGQAMARNPFCLLVPCHRVVPKSGGIGQYRWGSAIKQKLLGLESTGKNAWEIL